MSTLLQNKYGDHLQLIQINRRLEVKRLINYSPNRTITNAVAGAFSPHNFAFSIKILHAQCTISLLELSPSGYVLCYIF